MKNFRLNNVVIREKFSKDKALSKKYSAKKMIFK